MRPALQRAAFLHRIHAPDAGHDARTGGGIKPLEFLAHLDRELARRGDHQPERMDRKARPLTVEDLRGDGEPEGDGLARPGLGRDDEIAAGGLVGDDGGLHRGKSVIATRGDRLAERRMYIGLLHVRAPTAKRALAIEWRKS